MKTRKQWVKETSYIMKYREMLDKFWEEMEISIKKHKQKGENRGGLKKGKDL